MKIMDGADRRWMEMRIYRDPNHSIKASGMTSICSGFGLIKPTTFSIHEESHLQRGTCSPGQMATYVNTV